MLQIWFTTDGTIVTFHLSYQTVSVGVFTKCCNSCDKWIKDKYVYFCGLTFLCEFISVNIQMCYINVTSYGLGEWKKKKPVWIEKFLEAFSSPFICTGRQRIHYCTFSLIENICLTQKNHYIMSGYCVITELWIPPVGYLWRNAWGSEKYQD